MTAEQRKVAAFLLREFAQAGQQQGRHRDEGAEGGGSGGHAVWPDQAERARVEGDATSPAHGNRNLVHALTGRIRPMHHTREFAAFAALLKLGLILLTLFASAPEFAKSGGIPSPARPAAASVSGRLVPGVPARVAEEYQAMMSIPRSIQRSSASSFAMLPLLFATSALAQGAVEWKKSDGGNGHWYQQFPEACWELAQQTASGIGGHLATITSRPEAAFVGSIFPRNGYWDTAKIGGKRSPASGLYDFAWVTGEAFDRDTLGWQSSNPGCCGPDEFYLCMNASGLIGDITNCGVCVNGVIVEWSADCNGDGIVDYGQILSGELVDANGNGVPDCCDNGETCMSGLVANGSFEAGSPLAACTSESVTSGSLVGSGWQVSAGTVDRIRGGATCASATQPKFGDYCIDLCGTPASSGAIRQIVATIPGHKYRCTFWLSGDARAAPATKKVHAKVGTYIDLSYTFACSGSGAQSWVVNQFEFTARGASETLEFVADNGVTTGGPMLDAINLADITTQCVGDIDASGEVDGADISLLLLNFGPCSTTP